MTHLDYQSADSDNTWTTSTECVNWRESVCVWGHRVSEATAATEITSLMCDSNWPMHPL